MTTQSAQIRIVIADDHYLILRGLRLLLSRSAHIEIIGEALNGDDALRMTKELEPDVLVTDISMPGLSGIELTKRVICEKLKTKVLILSNFFDEKHVLDAYAQGARGYLPKSIDDEHLVFAIGKIARNEIFYDHAVLDILGTSLIQQRLSKENNSDLSERELEVLRELVNGATNKEISETLFISVRTVDAHRRNIMKKLRVKNSAQLVKEAFAKKLV